VSASQRAAVWLQCYLAALSGTDRKPDIQYASGDHEYARMMADLGLETFLERAGVKP